jgi:hypothetical protein
MTNRVRIEQGFHAQGKRHAQQFLSIPKLRKTGNEIRSRFFPHGGRDAPLGAVHQFFTTFGATGKFLCQFASFVYPTMTTLRATIDSVL